MLAPQRRPSSLLAGLAYALAAAVFTWPLVLHPRGLFGAADPTGDPSLNLWTLGWDLRVLSTHPGWLLNGRVFDASIFFPARQTLAYSDHLLLQALALWPIHAATGDLVLCYNVLLLASLAASALAMHVLVRNLLGSEPAAYVAGLVFGFAPYHFTHLTHIQLQALYFLPLTFLFLHRVFERRRIIDAIGLGSVTGLQAVSSAYYGIIGAIGLAAAALVLAIGDRRWRDWTLIQRSLLAVVIAVFVALPWMVPYLRVERQVGAGRNLYEAEQASAVPASYLQAPGMNLLYGRTGLLTPAPGQRLPRKDGPEQGLFPGFVSLALAAWGLIAAVRRRDAARIALPYLAVGVAGFLLSLGPGGIRPLYAALYDSVVGMEAIRASARFSVLVLFAVAVLAAIGVRALGSSRASGGTSDRQAVAAGTVFLCIALEFCNGAIPFPVRPQLVSEAGQWLSLQPGTGAVICLPMGLDRENTPCMLQSLEHGRPIVNGYSGLRPPFFAAVADSMSRMPSADALLTLNDLNVEYVVTERPIDLPPALAGMLVERAAFDKQRVYQTSWSPDALALLAMDSGPAPPEPGPRGFQVGESATYQVRWTSGPLNVPAGEMTIGVAAPHGDEAFRFIGSAKTAPWVAQFYEAAAELETTAGPRLLPVEHSETISEGKRRIDRQVRFDFPNHRVSLASGGASITLPLAGDARDPMTALFYVRTLPLASGASFSLPLTDNGRPSRLEVTVAGREIVEVGGRSWEAWKVTPQLRERIERQTPLAITTWVSADERRLPLVIDIAAGFGRVRAELVSYSDK